MIKLLPGEKWKEIILNIKNLQYRYAVSSAGRIAVFKDYLENGKILSGTLNHGYLSLKIKPAGHDIQLMIHRLVARAFLPKPAKGKIFVIHKNYIKTDNAVSNLRWANQKEVEKHAEKNPAVMKSRKLRMTVGHKLNIARVKEIKQLLRNPGKLTMKAIARKYRISEMQLFRIKRGENWGHVR